MPLRARKTTNQLLLKSVEEIRAYWSRWPNSQLWADLHGLITRVTNRGGIVFINITDGTGPIQVVCQKEEVGAEHWQRVAKLKIGQCIRVQGRVGETERKQLLSVFPSCVPETVPEIPGDSDAIHWPSIGRLGHQITLARIRRRSAEFLARNSFLEIEPLLISVNWARHGIRKLEVNYPGFGAPVTLSPSPAPQLLKTLATVGYPKVFAIAKAFTSDYTDLLDGTERLLVLGKVLDTDATELQTLTLELLSHVLSDVAAGYEDCPASPDEWLTSNKPWPPPCPDDYPRAPDVEAYPPVLQKSELFGPVRVGLFRARVPDQRRGKMIALADGCTEEFENGLTIGSFCVHASRIAQVVKQNWSKTLLHLGLDSSSTQEKASEADNGSR